MSDEELFNEVVKILKLGQYKSASETAHQLIDLFKTAPTKAKS
jgi:hypothetical protein